MTEQNKTGVQDTVEFIDFAASLINTLREAKSPDSPGGEEVVFAEYIKFINPLSKFFAGIAGVGNVKAELLDEITPDERSAIINAIGSISGMTPRKLEAISDHIDVLVGLRNLVFKWYVKA